MTSQVNAMLVKRGNMTAQVQDNDGVLVGGLDSSIPEQAPIEEQNPRSDVPPSYQIMDAQLLKRAYRLTRGDIRKAVDFVRVWQEHGLPAVQMQLHLVRLVENGCLQPPTTADCQQMFLTNKAMAHICVVKTRK